MKTILTRHAKGRGKQRGVGSTRAARYARGGTAQGGGVYKKEIERNGIRYVVVYKVVGGKKIILTTWRK